MIDVRPIGYVIGLLVLTLGVSMVLPLAVDAFSGNGHSGVFVQSAIVTILAGGLVALACSNSVGRRLTIPQTFLLTTGTWLFLPVFGAIPFVLGATDARFVDAFFEAMSGLTTTGSTVFTGLESLPDGLLLWRAMLQWFGGIGIIVVAMAFLPELRVGGMQIFRSEGFDTFGKILPRAGEIASRISVIYAGLTLLCALAYIGFGMDAFSAICHAMTTVATGGFANNDGSFSFFGPGIEYMAVIFMLLAALPFVRYVQLLAGTAEPLYRDSQIRVFLMIIATSAIAIALWLMLTSDRPGEESFRKALFNTTSIVTGTGYASANYSNWGPFPVTLIFFLGLVGGCAGSTSCSIKVFRWQLLVASIATQIKRIHSPNGMFQPRYEGRSVGEDVLSSVMAFFVLFFVSLGVLSILLGATGLDPLTATSGAVAALANIGPGLGPEIGPAGTYKGLSDTAKWLLAAGMLVGRLELMAVFVIFTAKFWRV